LSYDHEDMIKWISILKNLIFNFIDIILCNQKVLLNQEKIIIELTAFGLETQDFPDAPNSQIFHQLF